MNNYDDYDPEVHRSRVAKKMADQEAEFEAELQKARERQQEYASRAREKQTSVYSTNTKVTRRSMSENLDLLKASKENSKAKRKAAKSSESSIKEKAKKKVEKVAVETGIKEKASGSNGKKYKLNIKQLIKFVLCICIVIALGVVGYCAVIIHNAPEIDTSDVNSLLTQSSILYDDQGEIIDNVFGDKNRTIVEIGDIPLHTQKAFIALEDKTFEKHHGFNIVRIFGALKDALFNGGHISGTSTITQQLARNLYMEDIMSERSVKRKLIEAYYSVQLEKNLTKDQILEAYLNCVNFGDIYGIQTAAQTYFSKDVNELSLAESAWLACIPQYPAAYKLIKTESASQITEETENLIYKSGKVAYLWNDAGKDRKNTCLWLMMDQGYIDEEEYQKSKEVELSEIINPTSETLNEVSNYFADYVIQQVITDLMDEYGYDKEKAHNIVYNSGIEIYTTLDTTAQKVLEKEFDKNSNFPVPTSYRKDSDGNILQENGSVLLYKYTNYIENDTFRLKPSEYEWNSDGSLTIYQGKRLAIYNTTVNGTTDYSVEFRNMYYIDDDTFYSVPGGYLNIPQEYKSRDSENNLVISAQFFTDYPSFFEKDGKYLVTCDYSLRQRVVQPQAAMTIIDNKTGQIKAMIGGRQTTGRMLYNRATATRQPGSSIKPLAVYSSALQQSNDLANDGKTFTYTETGFDTQGTQMWGDFITASSIVVDEKMTVNGKVWPKNSYSGYRGSYTFRRALQQSVNVCAVKILSQVGVDYAYDMVEKFGITSLVKSGDANDVNLAAMGMGGLTQGVSTLEMASAYTTFVNEGVHKSYSCYTKVVTKSGDVLLEPEVTETEVLDAGVAWIMRDILQTVVTEGIGYNAKVSGAKVGGKTGTTNDSYDIWFDGFTANYTASLWIGNDVNIKLSSMSSKAASLWSKVMSQIPNAKGGTYSKKPSNVIAVTIDTDTGMLPTDDTKHTRKEYFTKGTEPTRSGASMIVSICSETGLLATPDCPDAEDKVLDMTEVPAYYCDVHNSDPSLYPTEYSDDEEPEIGDEDEDIPDPWTPEYDEWLANQ